MEDRLYKHHFPVNDTIKGALAKWVLSVGVNFFKGIIQVLVDPFVVIVFWIISLILIQW